MSFLADYRTYVQQSEAPEAYHIWSALSVLSAVVGRRVWDDHLVYKRIYPNLYVVLVGQPGNRKTSALTIARDLLAATKRFPTTPDSITREALIDVLASNERSFRDPTNKAPYVYCHGTIISSEFSEFMGSSQNMMTSFLTGIYDHPEGPFTHHTRKDGARQIANPYLSILACTTPAWINSHMKTDVITGGLSRRTVFVYETAARRAIPFPERTKAMEEAWPRMVAAVNRIAGLCGPMSWSPAARDWYRSWYPPKMDHATPYTIGYYESKADQLMKVATLLCLTKEKDPFIFDVEHLELSAAILDGIEPNLPKIFESVGRNDLAPVASRLTALLQQAGGSLPEKKARAILWSDANGDDMTRVIFHLQNTNQLIREGDAARPILRLPHSPRIIPLDVPPQPVHTANEPTTTNGTHKHEEAPPPARQAPDSGTPAPSLQPDPAYQVHQDPLLPVAL